METRPAPLPPSTGRTDTRTRLLDAGRDLLAEGGWSAVSSREIARRAGANLAAINYHFGSQAELLLAVVDRSTERLVRDYGPHHLANDPAAFMRAAVETIPAVSVDPDVRAVYSAVLRSTRDPELHRLLRGKLETIRELFRGLLAERIPDAGLRDAWVVLLAALLDGLLLHVLIDDSTEVGGAATAIEGVVAGLTAAAPAGEES